MDSRAISTINFPENTNFSERLFTISFKYEINKMRRF